jgi:hypothetical protein
VKKRPLLVALFAFSTITVFAADAEAQFGGFGGGMGGSRGGRSGSRGGGDSQGGNQGGNRNERLVQQAPEANNYEQTEYRLSLFQEDLRVTAEQSAAWQAFAGKTRAYASDLAREKARGMRMGSASANQALGLQHLGETVDAARNRLTALEDLESSARALYQTLTPDQKTLADMRIPTIIAPRSALPGNRAGDNLPDLGSAQSGPARSR